MLLATAATALLAAVPALGQAVRRADDDGKPSGEFFLRRPTYAYPASTFFPPNRGSSSLVSGISPCQGFEQGSRVDYPLTGGVISWGAVRDIKDIYVRYSTDENPTSQDQFQDAIANANITGYTGEVCMPGPDFTALGLSAGDKITMQFSYAAGPQRSKSYEVGHASVPRFAADPSAWISRWSLLRRLRRGTGILNVSTGSVRRRRNVSRRLTRTCTPCSRLRRRRRPKPRASLG